MALNKQTIVGQTLSLYYRLLFDAVETWQSRLSDLTSYCA